jgi:hypothetical protein
VNKRLTLAVAATAAGLLAVPSFADAATTCSFDSSTQQVNIQFGDPRFGDPAGIKRTPGDFITVADNAELRRACFGLLGGNGNADFINSARAVSATGKLAVARGATTIVHHGKAVPAKLGLKVAKTPNGRTLSIDSVATDKAGKTQAETAAPSIRLNS